MVSNLWAHLYRAGRKDRIQQSNRIPRRQRQEVEASLFEKVPLQDCRHLSLALQEKGEKPRNSLFGGGDKVLMRAGSLGILTERKRKGGDGGEGSGDIMSLCLYIKPKGDDLWL